MPGGGLYDRREAGREHILPPPYVVKPNAEGSSVGVFIVREGANRPPVELLADDWAHGDEVLVEPYIAGRELCVAVLGEAAGPRALAVTDIVAADGGWYDYEAKYGEGGLPPHRAGRVAGGDHRQGAAPVRDGARGAGLSRTDPIGPAL